MLSILLLTSAAFLAGALNAVAGGGTFLTFPALVFLGLPPIPANATSTVAVLPGYVASALAFRRDIGPVGGTGVAPLVAAALAGGLSGAGLLLVTPPQVFGGIVPWLLLVATALFAAGPRLTRWAGRHGQGTEQAAGRPATLLTVFAVAVYGGYFNGGLGILLLAAFGLLGLRDLNHMNGLKNLLSAVLTVISAATFAAAGIVAWREAAIMAAAATLGGYAGGRAARHVPAAWLRAGIVAVGLVMAALFFLR